jgi:hypothetical protein
MTLIKGCGVGGGQSGGWGGSKSTKINVAGEGRVRAIGGADERSMLGIA